MIIPQHNTLQGNKVISWKVSGVGHCRQVTWRRLYEKVLFQLGRKALKEQLEHTHEAKKPPMRLKQKSQEGGKANGGLTSGSHALQEFRSPRTKSLFYNTGKPLNDFK